MSSTIEFSAEIKALSFSPDGQTLAVMLEQSLAPCLVDVKRRCISTPTLKHRHRYPINSIALTNRYVYSGDRNGLVSVWSLKSHEFLQSFKNATNEGIHAIVASEKYLACGSSESISIRDAQTNKRLALMRYNCMYSQLQSLAISNDGTLLACSSQNSVTYPWTDNAVCVWRVPTGSLLCKFQSDCARVCRLTFAPDDRLIVCGSDMIEIWNTVTWKQRRLTHDWAVDNDECAKTVSRDGRYIACSSMRGKTLIIDAKTGQCVKEMIFHSRICCSEFSPSGQVFAIATMDRVASKLHLYHLVDLDRLVEISLALLQYSVAPYVVLDIFNFLNAEQTSFETE